MYIYGLFNTIYLPGRTVEEKNVPHLSCILSEELEMHVLFKEALFEKSIVAIHYTILIFSFCITCTCT